GEAAHMHFVDHQFVAADVGGFHALPVETLVDDQPVRHEGTAVAVVAHQVGILSGPGDVPAENAVFIPEGAGQCAGVRVEEKLARVETMTVPGVERTFGVKAVLPTGSYARHESHEHM